MDKVVAALLERYQKNGYLVMSSSRGEVVCAHVNGLAGWALAKLSSAYVPVARLLAENVRHSPLWSSGDQLFYREIRLNGEITIRDLNLTKNLALALLFAEVGIVSEANQLLETLYRSSLRRPDGLFARQINADGSVWSSVVVQSHLWYLLLCLSLGKKSKADGVWDQLLQRFVLPGVGLFLSQNCERAPDLESEVGNFCDEVLADDQALAVLVAHSLGTTELVQAFVHATLESPLYDPETGLLYRCWQPDSNQVDRAFTAYKNGLWALALAVMGEEELCTKARAGLRQVLFDESAQLYRSSNRDGSFIPDNVMLAHLGMTWPIGKPFI